MAAAAAAAVQLRKEREKAKKSEQEKSDGQPSNSNTSTNQPSIPVVGGPNNQRFAQGRPKKQNGLRPSGQSDFDSAANGGGNANVILYIGLGMVAIGLVITFVGLGDKGFRTLELKLIGPSLVGCGVFFALLRILFCTLPTCCNRCNNWLKTGDEEEKLISQQNKDPTGQPGPGAGIIKQTNRPTDNALSEQPPGRHPQYHIEDDQRERVRSSHQGNNANSIQDNSQQPQPTTSGNSLNRRTRLGREHDQDSLSSSSSTFSDGALGDPLQLAPHPAPDLGGSVRRIHPGEIILNATRLRVEPN